MHERTGGPEFPLTITSHRDGDAWTFDTCDELAQAVASLSTDDPAHAASAIDALGRATRLVVENGHVLVLELLPGWPALFGEPPDRSA